MPFDDLLAFFDPTLPLPIAGKTYTVTPPDHATGLRLAAWEALAANAASPDDLARLRLADDSSEALNLIRDALGPVHEQMTADEVPLHLIRHAGQTAFVWITRDYCKGTTSAERVWTSPGKAPGSSPTSRDPSTSSSTGEGSTTPSPVSGSGTTSHPKRRRASKAK